jgi:hexosaminidase
MKKQQARFYFSLHFLLLLLLLQQVATAQIHLPQFPDSIFSTYYHQRVIHFKSLPNTKDDIIFVGNSITDGGEWSELFNDLKLKNRGISGDVTAGVLSRIEEVAQRKPSKVFLLIGTNDLARGVSPDSVVKNSLLIASYLKQQTPSTQLFVQSILPVTGVYGKFGGHTSKGTQIQEVNRKLQESADRYAYTYIDLFTPFSDKTGKLKAELTNDGLHLTGKGYLLWKHLVFASVYGLQQTPSLIPQPQKLQWKKGYFALYDCRNIVVSHSSIRNEALQLQAALKKKGLSISMQEKKKTGEKNIILQLGKVSTPMLSEEGYSLDVSENEIVLTANTSHGIFNGIQALIQLARSGVMINTCSITDWPSFAWRGYMIDVGRNYMSIDLLKEQIDVMAAYKLNVFHFHPTEDVAWRLASKLYPQLTAPEHMLRNKGMYYSEAEIKELIAYCKDRHVMFVPEIDMPGHSAAFKRAMKTDMQSDSGIVIVKNILKEFSSTYDVPYIHIGADEVKITNQNFIPEVTALLHSLGKKVIGWEPGGNFDNKTIRQLWMDDPEMIKSNTSIHVIFTSTTWTRWKAW